METSRVVTSQLGLLVFRLFSMLVDNMEQVEETIKCCDLANPVPGQMFSSSSLLLITK